MDVTDFLIKQKLNPSEKIPTKNGLYIRLYDILDEYEKQFSIHNVSVSFEEGYEKGWKEATSEACKEIAKNYQTNER